MRPSSTGLPLATCLGLGLGFAAAASAQTLGGEGLESCCFLRLEQPTLSDLADGLGARSLAMAGATTALGGDLSAALSNPAALASLSRLEAAVSIESSAGAVRERDLRFELETTYRPFEATRPSFPGLTPAAYTLEDQSWRADTDGPRLLAVAVPRRIAHRPVVFLLAARRIASEPDIESLRTFRFQERAAPARPGRAADTLAGLSTQRYAASTGGDAKLFTVAAGSALRLARGATLRLGVGWSRLDWDTTTTASETIRETGLLDGETFEVRIDRTRSTALSFTDTRLEIGAQLELGAPWTLGAVYRTGFETGYDATDRRTFEHSLLDFAPGELGRTSTVDSRGRIQWPRSTAVGVAFRPLPTLTLTLERQETAWSSATLTGLGVAGFAMGRFDPRVASAPSFFSELAFPSLVGSTLERQRDAASVRFGAEAWLEPGPVRIPLRAGVFDEDGMAPVYRGFARSYPRVSGWALGTGVVFGNRSEIGIEVSYLRRTASTSLTAADRTFPSPLAGDDLRHTTERWMVTLLVRR